MKIERFVLGGLVAVFIFIGCITLLGDGILQKNYGASNPPTFSDAESLKTEYSKLNSEMETKTIKGTEPGQSNDEATGDDRFWTYQGQALGAVWSSVSIPSKSKDTITSLGDYLLVNPLVITGILLFLTLSFSFAVVAFWKNRRP